MSRVQDWRQTSMRYLTRKPVCKTAYGGTTAVSRPSGGRHSASEKMYHVS